ncbi:MAG TPA: hypothetical protein VFJ58_14015 [Armatimonadota bacterium]|nr:hypothetical protein [Armatimonadota bacterium]
MTPQLKHSNNVRPADSEGGSERRRPWFRWTLAAVLTLAFALWLGLHFLGPPSPELVRDRTIQALETGDTAELIALSDPRELNTLHLTPENVYNMLHETLWRGGHPRQAAAPDGGIGPADRAAWSLHWLSDRAGGTGMAVTVIDYPDTGWKLNLSGLLHDAACWSAGSIYLGNREFHRLCGENGIIGAQDGNAHYIMFKRAGPTP